MLKSLAGNCKGVHAGLPGLLPGSLAVVGNILVAHRTGLTSKLFDVGIQAAALVRELLGVPGYKGQNGTRRLTYVCEGWMSSSLLSSAMCELNPLQVYECPRHPLRFHGVELGVCRWDIFLPRVHKEEALCSTVASTAQAAQQLFEEHDGLTVPLPRVVVHLHLSHALKTS